LFFILNADLFYQREPPVSHLPGILVFAGLLHENAQSAFGKKLTESFDQNFLNFI